MKKNENERSQWREADQILDELLTLDPSQREKVLAAKTLTTGVAKKVRQLLSAVDAEGGLLDQQADQLFDLAGGEIQTDIGLAGRRLGPFEIEDEIGRGGMSVVFSAHRVDGSFEQHVALKLLTVAYLSSESRARFNKEQSILARLHHPNIAGLIDGGISADGMPWLVMERINGETIDLYCDTHLHNSREIVELFLQVCDAVSYAHRNLIVHRDLKPDNVLVDSEARVHLLDFGIAKLLDEAVPEGTQTRAFTPRFAAPEQFTGEIVTTATDVYGMGGVLYRLLAREYARPRGFGPTLPDFESPPVPSRAENAVDGIDHDLDTVVLMALRPEHERRYLSAAEFGEDLKRWLEKNPVSAVPDSAVYRTKKFLQRRRALVASIAVLVISGMLGLGSTLWQAAQTRDQKEVAVREAIRAKAVTNFLVDLFNFAEPDRSQGSTWTVREALDSGVRQLHTQLKDQPVLRAHLLTTVGDIYRRLGLYDEAEPLLDEAIETVKSGSEAELGITRLKRADLALNQFDLDLAEKQITSVLESAQGKHDNPDLYIDSLSALAEVRRAQGRYDEASELVEHALAINTAPDETSSESTAGLYAALADIALEATDLDKAGKMYEKALTLTRKAHPGDRIETASLLESIGVYYTQSGLLEKALDSQRQALSMRERLLGDKHPDVAFSLNDTASVLRDMGRFDEAEPLYRRAYEIKRLRLGDDHPATLNSLNSLAVLAYDRGHIDEAADILTEVVETAKRVYGETHPRVAEFMTNLGAMRRRLGQYEIAEGLFLEALTINRSSREGPSAAEGTDLVHLGNLFRAKGDFDHAERYYNEAIGVLSALGDETHPNFVVTLANLAEIRFAQGHFEDAAKKYERAFTLAKQAFPKDHPSLMVIETRFARSLAHVGDKDRALEHATAAAAVVSRIYDADHTRVLEARVALGAALLLNGRIDESKSILDDVRARIDGGAKAGTAEDELQYWNRILSKKR